MGRRIIGWLAGIDAVVSLGAATYAAKTGATKILGDLTIHPMGWVILASIGIAVLGAVAITPERVRLWWPWGPRNSGDLDPEVVDLADALSNGKNYYWRPQGSRPPLPLLVRQIAALKTKLGALRVDSPPETSAEEWGKYVATLGGWTATKDLVAAREHKAGISDDAYFAEVDHRFRGCGSRISAKWNARRSVATFVVQFAPIGVATGCRYPTRDLV